jgi:hypothetical protein
MAPDRHTKRYTCLLFDTIRNSVYVCIQTTAANPVPPETAAAAEEPKVKKPRKPKAKKEDNSTESTSHATQSSDDLISETIAAVAQQFESDQNEPPTINAPAEVSESNMVVLPSMLCATFDSTTQVISTDETLPSSDGSKKPRKPRVYRSRKKATAYDEMTFPSNPLHFAESLKVLVNSNLDENSENKPPVPPPPSPLDLHSPYHSHSVLQHILAAKLTQTSTQPPTSLLSPLLL